VYGVAGAGDAEGQSDDAGSGGEDGPNSDEESDDNEEDARGDLPSEEGGPYAADVAWLAEVHNVDPVGRRSAANCSYVYQPFW
jgi:hypothetical protein